MKRLTQLPLILFSFASLMIGQAVNYLTLSVDHLPVCCEVEQ